MYYPPIKLSILLTVTIGLLTALKNSSTVVSSPNLSLIALNKKQILFSLSPLNSDLLICLKYFSKS